MKITCTFICLLLMVSQNSCKTERESGLENFGQLKKARNGATVFVIPGSGCTGCISGIETMALNNLNNDSLYFVFTRINSVKLFKSRYKQNITSYNLIMDTTNAYNYPDQKFDIYPVMYKKRNGVIEFIQYKKP